MQNLREVSVHLMRETSSSGSGPTGGPRGGRGVESGVHALATRWASAQLDASRALCRAICRALAATPAHNQQRGFTFMYASIHRLNNFHSSLFAFFGFCFVCPLFLG